MSRNRVPAEISLEACQRLLEDFKLDADAHEFYEIALILQVREQFIAEAPHGEKQQLNKALCKMARALALLDEASALAPQWSSLRFMAGRLQASHDSKSAALDERGKKQDGTLSLERKVEMLKSFWRSHGRTAGRSVNPKGSRDGSGSAAQGDFHRFVSQVLESLGQPATDDRIDHAIRAVLAMARNRGESG